MLDHKEIGSEFSDLSNQHSSGMPFPQEVADSAFTFSGRTAIETVLNNEPHVKKALLPSYCCHSMIEPFSKKGISIDFYDVSYNNGFLINSKKGNDLKHYDLILWCNYFGFKTKMPSYSEFIERGGIIIEDITHSLYSKQQHDYQSTYLIASLRKWEPMLCGGYISSIKKKLNLLPSIEVRDVFIKKKIAAMKLKNNFLQSNLPFDKKLFLKLFDESNSYFYSSYSNTKIDALSLSLVKSTNFKEHRLKRIQNAKSLYKYISEKDGVSFLFPIEKMDCPLFVPIVINPTRRKILIKSLIDNQIYCPIHWPRPIKAYLSNLYDIELSLVCDHRYNENDMKKIAKIVNDTKEF